MDSIYLLLIYAFIGSVAGLIGGLILLSNRILAKRLAHVSIPLAAGVLLAVSFLDLFPEAVAEIGDLAFTVVLIVFVVLFLIERFLLYFHHHQGDDAIEGESGSDHSHKNESSIPLIIFGDTIHNFIDGIAIGTAFLINPSLSLVVAISTFLHETPHEIADFGILIAKGWKSKKVFMANLLSSMATFPGAILAYKYAEGMESGVGIMVAIAAGFFLYVATTDFIPDATHSARTHLKESAVFLLIGVVAVILLNAFIPEIGH